MITVLHSILYTVYSNILYIFNFNIFENTPFENEFVSKQVVKQSVYVRSKHVYDSKYATDVVRNAGTELLYPVWVISSGGKNIVQSVFTYLHSSTELNIHWT